MVMPKADQILRKFILDVDARERILSAWLRDEVTLKNAESFPSPEETETNKEEKPVEEPVPTIDKIRYSIKDILKGTLADVEQSMRPQEEVLDSVFYVLGKETLETLDGVGLFISRAFSNLFVKEASIVDKHVAFNLLVTKFEAYLKKLYYLMEGKEVSPQYEGNPVTWKDVIHAVRPLWKLKYSEKPAYKTLYQYLLMVKEWRNNEAHISPTASEQEINVAINIVITMYFFATGSCITELESNGHDVETHANIIPLNSHPSKPYSLNAENSAEYEDIYSEGMMMVAERSTVQDLEEATRLEILKNCITKLLNYSYNKRNAVFCKQRHWEAIYRVAVDYGFTIDGDYNYFKSIVDGMHLHNLPYALTPNFLANHNVGIYAKDLKDWTSEGLEGKELSEYEEVKKCADIFETIVRNNIREYQA